MPEAEEGGWSRGGLTALPFFLVNRTSEGFVDQPCKVSGLQIPLAQAVGRGFVARINGRV